MSSRVVAQLGANQETLGRRIRDESWPQSQTSSPGPLEFGIDLLPAPAPREELLSENR